MYADFERIYEVRMLIVSTTPLWQWGFPQCLPVSWTTLKGKHCRHSIAIMAVVDTFEPRGQLKVL